MSKVKTHKTAEQHRAEAKQLHEKIAAAVEELAGGEQWQRFLEFAAAFHHYSLNNVLLILAQRPQASRVAGFRKWQQLGRQVRKGEKSIRIYGYAKKKIKRGEGTEDEDTNRTDEAETFTYYPTLSVFDIAQTDQIEGAEPLPETPADVQQLDGDDPDGIAEAVGDWIAAQGWTIEREGLTEGLNGYTDPESRRIVIAEGLAPAHIAKTTIHEAAHAMLHADDSEGEYRAHRGRCEVEAESVAYIVAGVLGLDTSAYSNGYVTGWAGGDSEVVKTTASRVLSCAHRIISEITTPAEEIAA